MTIALNYTLFAVLATLTNIAAQDLSLVIYSNRHALLVSVLAGTAAGLLLKYQLDKRYIFGFSPRDLIHDSRTFVLYTSMGVLTTAVFWVFEFTFEFLFQDKYLRYLGAVIGLAVGYSLKYQLDRRFVFLPRER
jgi:putative flippase GtrA